MVPVAYLGSFLCVLVQRRAVQDYVERTGDPCSGSHRQLGETSAGPGVSPDVQKQTSRRRGAQETGQEERRKRGESREGLRIGEILAGIRKVSFQG